MLKEISNLPQEKSLSVVLIYTTMCGTCEMAKRMLTVVSETIKDVQFYQLNGNIYSELLKPLDITSIPCFLILKNGEIIEQFYAFHSVPFLFEKITSLKA